MVAVAAVLVVATASSPSAASWAAAAERVGIDQLHIRVTADGHLLDLRYRVVDPERARSLLARDSTAYIVHQRTGRRLPVPSTPKAGALRNRGVPRAGKTYFALFANAGGIVRRGDRVTVVLGELAAQLVVE